MKTMIKVTLFAFFVMSLAGCNGVTTILSPTTHSEEDIMISFDSKGGNQIEDIIYNSGLTIYPSPSKPGYYFAGWFLDEGLTQEFNLDIVITESITLYAKWIEEVIVIYQLYTLEDLNTVRYDLDGDFTLMESIYIPGDWEPIGTESNPFTGTFNGNGYTIEQGVDEAITDTVFGLFGYLEGEVYDLHLIQRMSFEQDQSLIFGSLAGVSDGGYIHDCTISTYIDINLKNINGYVIFGNLVGKMIDGIIENVSSNTDIEFHVYNSNLVDAISQNIYIGGLVGQIESGSVEFIETKGVLYYFQEDIPAIIDCDFVTSIGGIAAKAYDSEISYIFSNYQIGGEFYNYNQDIDVYLSGVVGISEQCDLSMIDVYTGGTESDYEGNLDVYIGGIVGLMQGGTIIYVSCDFFIRNFTYGDMSNGHFSSGLLIGYAKNIDASDIMNGGNIQYWYNSESNAPILAGGAFGYIEDSSIDRIAINASISVYSPPITSSCLVGKIYGLNENVTIGTIYKFVDYEFFNIVFYDMWIGMEHLEDLQPGELINGYEAFYQAAYDMLGSDLWTYPNKYDPPYLRKFLLW